MINRMIDGLVRAVGRLFRWMFGTRNGWIFFGSALLVGMLYFQPQLLAQTISDLLAGILNLLARIVQANQKSLEYLFVIALMCFGIVLMFRGVFGKKGGGKK